MSTLPKTRSFLQKRAVDGIWEENKSSFHKTEIAIIEGVTSGTIGTQTSHAHGLPITPHSTAVMILSEGAGTVYQSANPDETNIYVKGTAANIPFNAWILYERKVE